MYLEHYFPFITIITVLLLSPGPSVLLSINNGITYGARHAVSGVLGNVIAFQLLVYLSAFGIGTLIASVEESLFAIRIAGAIYLCYLGQKLWRSNNTTISNDVQSQVERMPKIALFKQAFWVTLLNPKALIFVLALLPQFIVLNRGILAQTVILSAISASIHFAIYLSYAALASRAKNFIHVDGRIVIYNRISGVIFILFGLSLALYF